METNRSLNVIEADGRQFLLTATAGDAIHLTREANGEEIGQAAIPAHYLEDFERTYDVAAIVEPKWAERPCAVGSGFSWRQIVTTKTATLDTLHRVVAA
jgi:hypothetical protein